MTVWNWIAVAGAAVAGIAVGVAACYAGLVWLFSKNWQG